MEFERENPSPLARLPGGADPHWREWSPELETAYLQHLAGVEDLEDATSLQLVVNTAAGGSIAHLGLTLPNLHELNLNGSTLDSLRDLGTSFRLLQVLWVSRCGLKALDGLNGLLALRELYAAYNDITDLQPVDSCLHLEILDVECNCIADPDAVLYLASCTHLQTLTLSGNPASELPSYRRTVCSALSSLQSLDDEPVTAADRAGEPGAAPQSHLHPHAHAHSLQDAGGRLPSGGGSTAAHACLPPPPLKAAAAAVAEAAVASPSGRSSGGSATAAATAASQLPPDADELAFVVAGIKHARVGVDSHEFREIEMNLLVATADGTEVQLDVRPGTSTLLPASASTWVRTLRSSREGSLAALRASHAAAAASASVGRTGSQSPTSSCSASPIGSRPPSSQQQRISGSAAVPVPQPERWAVPAVPGASLGMSSSYGAWRPSSGTGICSSSGGGGGMGLTADGSMRPGSGGYRPGTGSNRPFSARPGTAASFSARIGTSASTEAAPVSSVSAAGLYWAKNRISGGSGGTSGGSGGADGSSGGGGGGAGGGGGSGDTDGVASSSKLTQGSDTTFGGSFARDLRKWKGAAVRAAASSAGGGAGGGTTGGAGTGADGTPSPAPANLGGGHGLSQTLLRGGQLDSRALLEELKRWKLETADKVLFVDPDEAASAEEWAGADGPDIAPGGALLGNGGGAGSAGSGVGHRPDILRLSGSQDGAVPDVGPFSIGVGLGLALLEQQGSDLAFSPAVPGSPMLQPAQPPAGMAAAGRCKMVLAKVLRDIAMDTVGGSSTCISEILAGLRPVHAPPAVVYGSSGGGAGGRVPGVAWGAPGDSMSSRPSNASTSSTPTPTHGAAQDHHRGQQQGGQRSGSAISVCSSSGQSDFGGVPVTASGQACSRPGSREEVGGGASGGGAGVPYGGTLQRQKSGSRAPGLPPGPSAPGAAYRVASVAGEVDVRSSNPSPVMRVSDW